MPMERVSLALSVGLAQSGDRQALDGLLRDHQAQLYRHACAILGDAELALDALQASLWLIARRLRTLRDPQWFRAWAYRITMRECLRLARRRGRERRLFDDQVPIEALDIAAADEETQLPSNWSDRIAELTPASEIVLRLHFLEGMRLVEIAEALEVPLGTVKSRLAYGLRRLRSLSEPTVSA